MEQPPAGTLHGLAMQVAQPNEGENEEEEPAQVPVQVGNDSKSLTRCREEGDKN